MTTARYHATAAAVWLILMVPSVVWWKDSVPWLVLISVWANFAGEFGAYHAAKTQQQVKQVDD